METVKKNNFKVEPLTTDKKSKRQIVLDVIPDPKNDRPFMMLISAKIASGKSVLLSNLIKHKSLYFRYFDKIYFCSSNVADGKINDNAYKGIKIHPSRLYDDFIEDIFNSILGDIRNDKEFDDSQYLLICDDLGPNFQHISKGLLKGLLKHRHYHLSVILIGQATRLFNPKIRQNASHLVCFYTDNKHERIALNEITNLNENTFNDIFDFATEEPYSFLYVDLLQPRKVKFYKNFNEEIMY